MDFESKQTMDVEKKEDKQNLKIHRKHENVLSKIKIHIEGEIKIYLKKETGQKNGREKPKNDEMKKEGKQVLSSEEMEMEEDSIYTQTLRTLFSHSQIKQSGKKSDLKADLWKVQHVSKQLAFSNQQGNSIYSSSSLHEMKNHFYIYHYYNTCTSANNFPD